MDKFFDRLGDVLKNFLHDDDEKLFSSSRRFTSGSGDPDLDAAYEELDDFLNDRSKSDRGTNQRFEYSFDEDGQFKPKKAGPAPKGGVPEALRKDFEELGLPLGAGPEECKRAYKQLLKIHHPDRHAGHPGNMKKATEKSVRINASYQRIERWRETGKID
jgi:DnaJ-domain-containing protein 1